MHFRSYSNSVDGNGLFPFRSRFHEYFRSDSRSVFASISVPFPFQLQFEYPANSPQNQRQNVTFAVHFIDYTRLGTLTGLLRLLI